MAEQAQAARTVTVACNLPNGLVIRGFKKVAHREAMIGGTFRDVEMWRPNGQEFTVRGTARPRGADLATFVPQTIVGGYALTRGCPYDLWESWLKGMEGHPLVDNKCVFAVERDAEGEAKRRGDVATGMEPIDSAGDKRMPKGGRGASAITTADKADA